MTNRLDKATSPCVRLTISMPKCTRTYGVAPCTAPLATTARRCFNTWATCLDRPNYDGSGKRDFRFITEEHILTGWRQAITDLQHTPPTLQKNWKLWGRERMDITLKDFVQAAENEDDDEWHSMRANKPYTNSYWARWLARNKYFNRRPALVEIGTISGDRFVADSVHHLFVESVEYTSRGASIKLIDGIKISKADGAVCPAVSNITLSADTDEAALVLKASAPLAPKPDYVSVGGEIMGVSSQESTAAPTTDNPARMEHSITVLRAQGGSERRSHERGDTIQPCYSVAAKNVVDIVRELLAPPFASLPPGVEIDDVSFNFERRLFLSVFAATNIVAKPEAVTDLLEQLQQSYAFRIFYNSATRKIEMKSILGLSAEGALAVGYSDANILKDSVRVKEDPRSSISSVYFYTRPYNFADTSNSSDKWQNIDNFRNTEIESGNARAEERALHIFSRWISPSQARNVAERLLRAGGDNEVEIEFQAAHRRIVALGQNFPFTSRRRVDEFGGQRQESFRAIRIASLRLARRLKISAQKTIYGGGALPPGANYFRIGISQIGGKDILL